MALPQLTPFCLSGHASFFPGVGSCNEISVPSSPSLATKEREAELKETLSCPSSDRWGHTPASLSPLALLPPQTGLYRPSSLYTRDTSTK